MFRKGESVMSKKPNIIVMLTDDLGYGDVSCMDPKGKIKTENLNKVAAEGLVLTDCHSASALCTPSRYALLTGRYNWRSRLKSMVLPGQSYHLIEEGRETIASMLKKQGYRTAGVGKWHLGMDWVTKGDYRQPETYSGENSSTDLIMDGIDFTKPYKNGPNAVGFDYYYGMPASLDQPPFIHIENDRAITQPTEMMGVRNLARHDASQMFDIEYGPGEAGYDPRAIVPEMDEKVLSLVEAYADQEEPFFIYYPTPAVHGPIVPSEDFQGKSGLNAYADFVLQVDGFIGRLDKLLEEKGIKDNTILVFTSDNGCSPVADFEALIAKGHNPSSIFRGVKGDIWEGGHRVPFIVRWPGHIAPGTRSAGLACLMDLFATFAEITGATYGDDAGEDSVSMLPLWTGEEGRRRDLIHHSAVGMYSIRRGDWKLEFGQGSGGFSGFGAAEKEKPYQLYNMEGDSYERWNLYGNQPEIERELLNLTARYIREGRSTPGAPQENTPNPIWPGLDFLKDAEA